jgi:hypothetical protein
VLDRQAPEEAAELSALVQALESRSGLRVSAATALRIKGLEWLQGTPEGPGPLACQSLVHTTALLRTLLIESLQASAAAVYSADAVRAAVAYASEVLGLDHWLAMGGDLGAQQSLDPSVNGVELLLKSFAEEWNAWKVRAA